ncbi:MAG: PTS sugar transporter subunit IIC [Clostridium neonatale]
MLESGEVVDGIFNISNLGASGMFVGMIVAFISAELHCFVKRKGWKISMPEMVPETVAKSFSALIPMLFSLTIVTLMNYVITTVCGDDLHSLIFTWLQAPLLGIGGSFGALMVTQFLIQFLWFFGIHGHNVVNPMITPILQTLGLQNLEAYTAGLERTNIFTMQFQEIFTVSLGGSGMTLIVVLMMIFFMKSKTLKSLGKLAIGPGAFNVNEPVIFGLPIVLNSLAFIPWVFGTMISAAIAYFAMKLGIVPLTTGVAIPWTTPIFISGMMATNSIMGGVLQLVQALIVGVIWFPFLKMMDKKYLDNDDI